MSRCAPSLPPSKRSITICCAQAGLGSVHGIGWHILAAGCPLQEHRGTPAAWPAPAAHPPPLPPAACCRCPSAETPASPRILNLNGDSWRFQLFDRPEAVPAGFEAADYDTSSWPQAGGGR
jgi:hypothetical protein